MTDPAIERRETFRIFMDYGQFYLFGSHTGDPTLIDRAIDDHLYATDGKNIVVISPHQNNFDMEIDVSLWKAAPAPDRDDWQIVVDEYIEIDHNSELRVLTVDGVNTAHFGVAAGHYRVDISGRDFTAEGWPGSTTPGDRWRVRLWPAQHVAREHLQPAKRWPDSP
ncbi:hypothetical protein ACHIPZ_18355 [Antrihabitans sp. NCIMB 15449]|uniref:Uncharacterized protein n=1 Tax=Antrihabitans spumae TaxID=3373370 RepID=A0ABW7JQ52_9NOCA